jgi:recombination protein RecT
MATGNSLTNKNERSNFSGFLTSEGIKRRINEVIGGNDGQRFMTSILSVVSNNPELAKCEHMSILTAAFIGESLKLPPSPQLGFYYMLPFAGKAVFVLGYKGYVQLAIRSGHYRKINVLAIKEGEFIHYDPFIEELEVKMINDESLREKASTTGYYVMFELMNGFRKVMYWSREKMLSHANKYSKAYVSDQKNKTFYSHWTTDFDGMGLKTMLRQIISKWGIMSIELQKAFEEDKEEVMQAEYVDTTPEQPKERITAKDAFFDDKAVQPELVKA